MLDLTTIWDVVERFKTQDLDTEACTGERNSRNQALTERPQARRQRKEGRVLLGAADRIRVPH